MVLNERYFFAVYDAVIFLSLSWINLMKNQQILANLMTFEGFMPKTAYLPHEIKTFYQKIKHNSLHTLIMFIQQLIPTFQLISLKFC